MLNAPVNQSSARTSKAETLQTPASSSLSAGEQKVHYTQDRTIRGPERNGLRVKLIHHPGMVGDRHSHLVLSVLRHPLQHKPRLAQ